MTQDGTGLLPDIFPLQIMFKLLADSWCAERSFPKKTIPSSFFGEYKYCWIILSHWIHILVIISCLKSFDSLQNQSFFRLFSQFVLFLVAVTYSFPVIISTRWLLNLC